MYRILFAALLAAAADGQTLLSLDSQTKNVDFTKAAFTRPVKTGAALPSTCSVGDLFFQTNAPAGSNLYGCASANTWTLQSGGGSGSLAIDNNGTLVGSRNIMNLIGVESSLQQIVFGVVLLAAILLSSVQDRLRASTN